MAVNLDDVFAGIASRPPHNSQQDLVESRTVFPVANPAVIEFVRIEPIAFLTASRKDPCPNRFRIDAADAHDRDASLARRGRDRGNGVFPIHKKAESY